ncbi:dUTP diphosphatase [Deinococcus metallilatus]|uniref:dUTP diphosphatase n=1 Tax=Deinococcus metallilatus TaxID=1211322 RepID=A0AAJ5F717_9DEIO|nr:dUTP diphosphatase [Deinococcus metallilatus]MBB5294179.1 dUTP pyrophosphatase [Deinococcus metallilatus]QBY08958.1 dUTP diphosphatase [Deinococcus metallilatus]RXJ10102.1 dUTP diphosphatase [Deinococcus metallilatus]TLK27961.1 dUTP diphosphatase [Deinococcus metallilatus]GMA16484.1 dUTPase [Deinococcus metallilatus]
MTPHKQRGFELVAPQHRKHPDVEIRLPRRGSRHSAGYDFHTPVAFTIAPGERTIFATDIKVYMQPDEYLAIYPRSSIGMKAIMITSTVGIVDSDFYSNPHNDGNIHILLHNVGDTPFQAQAGDRIAQGLFTKYLLADGDDLSTGAERQGGYGHTGR